MPQRDAERIELATTIQQRFAPEQTLTPLQARAFARCLQTAWEVDTIQWLESDSIEIFNQARKLVHSGRVLSSVEGGSDELAKECFQRAGELFEWLSRARDDLGLIGPLALFAAGSYQLGGLPAMASGLLAQTSYTEPGPRLYASFLRADFDQVIRDTLDFWNANLELTQRDAGEALFREGADSDVEWYATVELVRCLGLAAYSLRRGINERVHLAVRQLENLESVFMRSATDDIALLTYFLRMACGRYDKANIYHSVRALGGEDPHVIDRFERFARRQFARSRGILWQSQQDGIERLLNQSSFALCTPTGSGKTLVANLSILKELLKQQDNLLSPLALYIVPSRALAGEVEAKLTGELGAEFTVTGLYGGSDWGITDAWLTADRPTVLIATVEKAEALLRYLGPILVARMTLLIVDEAHQVALEDSQRERDKLASHENRAIRLESFISRLLARRPDVTRIALTAVAGGAAHPVARWIESSDDAVPVGTSYRSTRQAIGVLETCANEGSIRIDLLNGRRLQVRGRARPFYIPLRFDAMPQPPAPVRNSLEHANQNEILWTALHLAETDRRILISIPQKPEQTMRWYATAFDLPGWEQVPPFAPPEDETEARLFEEAKTVCADYCGADSFELVLLERGIATNHGQMPQRLRRMMVALIERGICPITVATATLTEGVNLPFDIIFLPSLKRSIFNPDLQQLQDQPMTTAEFLNLAGRAGRPGAAKGMEGLTLVGVPKRPSATGQQARRLQLRQVRDREREYDNLLLRLDAEAEGHGEAGSPLAILLASIHDRARRILGIGSEEEFLDWLEEITPSQISDDAGRDARDPAARLADSVDELDSLILSAIEEMAQVDDEEVTRARAEEILASIWSTTFASVSAFREDWMERALALRAGGVVETVYPDAAERRRLYDYGYTPLIGRRFAEVAQGLLDIVASAEGYGDDAPDARLAYFAELGALIADDPAYGYHISDGVGAVQLLENWTMVLAWWMKVEGAQSPAPEQLRNWQRFTADNLEFRLGTAIGAVVARAWSENADSILDTPTLDTWKETTGLPWFGFWARELLRWGTLEPFVAFALSQGLVRSREEGMGLRDQFHAWLQEERGDELVSEDRIDPRLFLKWQRSLPREQEAQRPPRVFAAELTGTDGHRGTYRVVPMLHNGSVRWLDASGFQLAVSEIEPEEFSGRSFTSDFDLVVGNDRATVSRVFG